jgi:hypothetical protein
VLQICLIFCCQNEGFGCDRTIYVDACGLHRLANVSNRAIVGYVNAFFATLQSDPYEWNSHRVMLLRALVYRAEMVVWAELFECGDERSCQYGETHKAPFLVKTCSYKNCPNNLTGRDGKENPTKLPIGAGTHLSVFNN